MNYVEFVNNLIKTEINKPEKVVLFGQNIAAGSCLGGLTKGLSVRGGKIINTTNCENSLCGFGFGLMLNGEKGIFFVKQLDFVLLGIDHLVNTFNVIRSMKHQPASGSFTIMPLIVDNGYQGPQSSLNNFSDFCSIARIEGYTITNKLDAEKIISSKLITPGFRIIGVSQRLFREELIEPENIIYSNQESTVFQYSNGQDATIVCFNFSFPQGWKLYKDLKENSINSSIFSVNSLTSTNWNIILQNACRTRNLIVIDDSKSENLSLTSLLVDVQNSCFLKNRMVFKRDFSKDNWLYPTSDQFEINNVEVINKLKQ